MPQDRKSTFEPQVVQSRPLSEVYPVLYIDAIHYPVRDNGMIRKRAAYVILGIHTDEVAKKDKKFFMYRDKKCHLYYYQHSFIRFYTIISVIYFTILNIKLEFSIYSSYNTIKKGGFKLCYASFHFRILSLTREKQL